MILLLSPIKDFGALREICWPLNFDERSNKAAEEQLKWRYKDRHEQNEKLMHIQ